MNLPLLAALLILQSQPVEVPADTLARYAGRYELEGRARELSPDDPFYRVTVENGALFVAPPGRDKDRAWPLSATRFESRTEPVQVTFEVDASGQAVRMLVHYMGYDIPAKKVGGGG